MRRFKEGDELTLEDVSSALQDAHDRNIKFRLDEGISNPDVRMSADGYYEFDSWEDYHKAFGTVSVEDAFKW